MRLVDWMRVLGGGDGADRTTVQSRVGIEEDKIDRD